MVVSNKEKTLSADKVHFKPLINQAIAIGNVRLVSQNDILTGKSLQINLESETGELTDGSLFISQNHLYIFSVITFIKPAL